MVGDVHDNHAHRRFELEEAGHTAFIDYRLAPGVITLVHTEVQAGLSGKGVGSRLVRGVLELARSQSLEVVPRCSFVAAYMSKHPEFNDLLA